MQLFFVRGVTFNSKSTTFRGVKIMNLEKLLYFKELTRNDLKYMHKWLNQDFVMKWYNKRPYTMKQVETKYLPYINKERPTQGYLIYYENSPIGYVQTYKIHDYEDCAQCVGISEVAAGLDIFIGEEKFLHKGLGKLIIHKFLKDIIFHSSETVSCILGCEIDNLAAIKAYEKAGFTRVKIVETEGVTEYIMRIGREDFQ